MYTYPSRPWASGRVDSFGELLNPSNPLDPRSGLPLPLTCTGAPPLRQGVHGVCVACSDGACRGDWFPVFYWICNVDLRPATSSLHSCVRI